MKTIKILFFTLLTIINTSIFTMELDTPNKNTLIEKMANLDSMPDDILTVILCHMIVACATPEEIFTELVKIAQISKKFRDFIFKKQFTLKTPIVGAINTSINSFNTGLIKTCSDRGFFLTTAPQTNQSTPKPIITQKQMMEFNISIVHLAKSLLSRYSKKVDELMVYSKFATKIGNLSHVLPILANSFDNVAINLFKKIPKLGAFGQAAINGADYDLATFKTLISYKGIKPDIKKIAIKKAFISNAGSHQSVNILEAYPNLEIGRIHIDFEYDRYSKNFIFEFDNIRKSMEPQCACKSLKILIDKKETILSITGSALAQIAIMDFTFFTKILKLKNLEFQKPGELFVNAHASEIIANMLPNNSAINQRDLQGKTQLHRSIESLGRKKTIKASDLENLQKLLAQEGLNPFLCFTQKNGLIKNALNIACENSLSEPVQAIIISGMKKKLEELSKSLQEQEVVEKPAKKIKMEK